MINYRINYLNYRRVYKDNIIVRKITAIGDKYYYLNKEGYFHRLDGPAIEYFDGDRRWYYNNKYIRCSSQEEFERLIKLRLFLES